MVTEPPVLVTGGSGTLGRRVVAELAARSVPARVLSRSAATAVGTAVTVPGNLATGLGLGEATRGVRAVVHCATRPTRVRAVDIEGTKRLLLALRLASPQAHLVYVSIVGCDANPLPYYRAKAAAETAVDLSPTPASVVRATQFHELVRRLAARSNFRVAGLSVRGLRFQPCDPAYVAARLVDVALGPRLQRRLDLAGPQVLTFTQAVRAVTGVDRVLELPPVGAVLRAFATGSNLPGPAAQVGGRSFQDWLAAR